MMIEVVTCFIICNINRSAEAITEWMRYNGVGGEGSDRVYQWLGGKIRWGGMEAATIQNAVLTYGYKPVKSPYKFSAALVQTHV